MENTPDSGSTEDDNKPQTDLGLPHWGLGDSAASESQEIAADVPLPFPEAEQASTESFVMLATTTSSAVGEQEDGASWMTSIDENRTTFPDTYLDTGHVVESGTDLVEVNQPLVTETLAQSPPLGMDSFLDGAQCSIEKAEDEERKTEESLWASVEPYEKVETRAVNLKELDHAEEFEERDCHSKENSETEHLEALVQAVSKAQKNTELDVLRDSECSNGQPEITTDNNLQEVNLKLNGEAVIQMRSENDAMGVAGTGLGAEISDNTNVEFSRLEPENGLSSWNQDHGTQGVDDLPFAGNMTIKCIQDREMESLTGLVDLDVRDKTNAEVEEPVCGDELCGAEESGKEIEDCSYSISQNSVVSEYQATFISFEKDAVLHPGSTSTADLSNSCLGNMEDEFADREAFSMAEEFNISDLGSMETDPWQANWDPTVSSDPFMVSDQTNGCDDWPFPPKQDSVDENMESLWPGFNDVWSSQDLGGLGPCWEVTGVRSSHQNEETPLKPGPSGEQANISSSGARKEIGRPLALFQMGTSRNASTESSASPKDPETNSSDLSEDEIANRRYGLLYQEIEADKEEASNAFNGFTQDTSLFSMQSNQNMMNNLAEAEEAPSLEVQAEEALSATDGAVPAPEPEAQPVEAGEPPAEAVDAVETEMQETTEYAEKECELQMDSVVESPTAPESVSVAPITEGNEVTFVTETEEVVGGDKPHTEGKEAEASQENLSNIPSVVIEPASNNEEDHDVVVNESKDAVEDVSAQGAEGPAGEPSETASEPPAVKEIPSVPAEEQPAAADDSMPPGFLYKVEALHDFEAANSDELNLARGDIILVVPSTAADQEAGWLTGIKESEWLQYRDAATYKGLFPENFIRRLE